MEPKRRKDGKCLKCRKPIPSYPPQRGVDPSVYAREPFCKRACAEAWFGVDPEKVLADGGSRVPDGDAA